MAQDRIDIRQRTHASMPGDARPNESGRRNVQIFDEAELAAFRSAAHDDGTPASETFMSRLCAAGSSRPLISPAPTWEAKLGWLSHVFPGFEEVIELSIRPSLRTAERGALPRPTPLLLTGAAEQEVVGFAGALARALDVPFFQFDVATMADPERNRPSAILSTLAFGADSHAAVANPVALAHLGRLRTPFEILSAGSLAKLLSVEEAQMAQDSNASDVHFDASFIRWIIWCAALDDVPVCILNQCHVMRLSPSEGF